MRLAVYTKPLGEFDEIFTVGKNVWIFLKNFSATGILRDVDFNELSSLIGIKTLNRNLIFFINLTKTFLTPIIFQTKFIN